MPHCWMTDYRENKLWKQLVTVALQSCYGRIPTQTQAYSCDSSAQTCTIFTLDTLVLDTVCKIWLPPLQSFHSESMRNLVTEATINLCYLKSFPHWVNHESSSRQKKNDRVATSRSSHIESTMCAAAHQRSRSCHLKVFPQ